MKTLKGTNRDDNLTGSDSSEAIYGYDGNDKIFALKGNDIIYAGRGKDILDGGSGVDTMYGSYYDDTYYVDNTGDKVIEVVNQGFDEVKSAVSFTLPNYVEKLTLTGSQNINAAGNSINNHITGNSGNNILAGANGNDTYFFENNWGIDTISDNQGSNKIVFNNNLTKNDLNFGKNGNNLEISEKSSTGQIIVKDWFTTSSSSLEIIKFSNGTTISGTEIKNMFQDKPVTITGTDNNDLITGNENNNIIYAKLGNDTIYGMDGNDKIYGGAGNDILNGGTGADTLEGGAGNDTYYVDNTGDKVIEESVITPTAPDWITSNYLKDIYTNVYPRVMGNQWGICPDGMFHKAARYTTVNGSTKLDLNASWEANSKLLDVAAKYLDYITINRAGNRTGTNDYNDLFLDNINSIKNPNTGLNAALNLIKDAANAQGNNIYVLPYLNITDVWTYESATINKNWTYWHSQELFNGQNFGTWDYCHQNNLFLMKDGQYIHYYGGTDSRRPYFDSTKALWQQYYTDHVKGIVDSGFDGIFSDNWERSQSHGDLYMLTKSEFTNLQKGYNTIGGMIQQILGDDKILIGNSPADKAFTTRDMCMLEDRIDDVLGTNDKSIGSYFRYSDLAESMHQVCQDTYYEEARGPFETFRLPINLMTDNILGLSINTDHVVGVDTYISPLKIIEDIGVPLGDRMILEGTATGVKDNFYDYSFARGVYVRYFSEGVVYLNASGNQQTIKLPDGLWLRSDGKQFEGGDSISIDNCRGWVFKSLEGSSYTTHEDNGTDTVIASISYLLPENVENLTLVDNNNLNGTGNSLDNIITGNSGDNGLYGNGGNDTLIDSTGDDRLYGGNGNDCYKFTNQSFGKDIIFDESGSSDIINMDIFTKSQANFQFLDFDKDGNIDSLAININDDNQIIVTNYFNNTSSAVTLSTKGSGCTETISFNDIDLSFTDIQSIFA